MSRETYDEYLRRPGRDVDVRAVLAMGVHVRSCAVCSGGTYAYKDCGEGLRLARRIFGLDKSLLRGAESARSGDDKE